MVLWSIHTLWYKGFAKKEKDKFGRTAIPLKNSSPDSKADFSKKSRLGVWRSIFGRYDTVSHS